MKRKLDDLQSNLAVLGDSEKGTYRNLFICPATFRCATVDHCIPCLYKIFPEGTVVNYTKKEHASSIKFIKLPPNQRPEKCFRAINPAYSGLYGGDMRLLTVGDGDFSFSVSLARNIVFTSGTLIATSHESRSTVEEVYAAGRSNLYELRSLVGVEVMHEIDATALSRASSIAGKRFDVIIWNFPCVRANGGADGQAQELEDNRALLRSFFSDAQAVLAAEGELHVTHKTIEPFSWWKITDLAEESGLCFLGSIVFDR